MLTNQSTAQEIKLYAKNQRAGESHLCMRQSTTQKRKQAHLSQVLRKTSPIQLLVECQDAYSDSAWSHSSAWMTDSRANTCERRSHKHEPWITTSGFLNKVYSSCTKVPCLWNGPTCKKKKRWPVRPPEKTPILGNEDDEQVLARENLAFLGKGIATWFSWTGHGHCLAEGPSGNKTSGSPTTNGEFSWLQEVPWVWHILKSATT